MIFVIMFLSYLKFQTKSHDLYIWSPDIQRAWPIYWVTYYLKDMTYVLGHLISKENDLCIGHLISKENDLYIGHLISKEHDLYIGSPGILRTWPIKIRSPDIYILHSSGIKLTLKSMEDLIINIEKRLFNSNGKCTYC